MPPMLCSKLLAGVEFHLEYPAENGVLLESDQARSQALTEDDGEHCRVRIDCALMSWSVKLLPRVRIRNSSIETSLFRIPTFSPSKVCNAPAVVIVVAMGSWLFSHMFKRVSAIDNTGLRKLPAQWVRTVDSTLLISILQIVGMGAQVAILILVSCVPGLIPLPCAPQILESSDRVSARLQEHIFSMPFEVTSLAFCKCPHVYSLAGTHTHSLE